MLTEVIHEIDSEEVFVRTDRHRQLFNRKPLEELIESIREVGQIQPGVCRKNDIDGIELLVGERRLKACSFLKRPFKYYLKEEIHDPLLLEQIQLDENLCREDLDWKEDLKAKERLHAIFQERFGKPKVGARGGHSFEDTADHIGVKKTILYEDVILAGFLAIPEVASAPNKTTAKKIVQRLTEQVKRTESLHKVMGSVQEERLGAPLTESARAELKFKEANKSPLEKTLSSVDKQILYFDKRCILGLMEEKITAFNDESIDIMFFDPPWGVDFKENKKESVEKKDYEDSPEDYTQSLEPWLRLLYSKMKPDSHLYMFAAITRIGFTYDILEKVGFVTHRIPIIWWKKGAHSCRAPYKWPGQAYEPICFVHKGGRKLLVQQGKANVIETPMPSPKLKDIHPSAKHPQIYKELLLRSASPGDTILDPMGGSGMLGVAAESLSRTHSLNWFLIEKDQDFRNLQILNLCKGYEELAKKETVDEGGGEPIRVASDPTQLADFRAAKDFQSLTPGTPSWKEYWKTHPEEQDSMLQWQKSKAL